MKLYINRIIGAIFCQVNITNLIIQFKPSIISGNQKWNGAAPILVKSAEFIKIIKISLKFWGINSNNKLIIIIENNKIIDAKAWVIKYFNAASEESIFLLLEIRGIIASRFISRPIHILNQLNAEIEIKVPSIRKFMNKNLLI